MKYQQSELIKSLIDELTLKLEKLEGVYLFGSRAQKTATKISDWDFGFLCREEHIEEIVWNIRTSLETKYDVSVDLVDLYKSNTILQIQVIKTGELIWEGNLNKVREFEYLTLSYYQKLNDERADILKDIKLRGNIYG